MGFAGWIKRRLGWTKKKEDEPGDLLAAYDRRLDTLARRGADLRRTAATLLAARGGLDRALEASQAEQEQAAARRAQASGRPDVLQVIEADLLRAQGRQAALAEERTRIDAEARALAEATARVEAEAEALRRERESAVARLAASRSLAEASSQVLSESLGELAALDRARDEVERAHALADLAAEDLESPKR